MGTFRNIIVAIRKKVIYAYFKFNKYQLLTPEETIRSLEPCCIGTVPGSAVALPEIPYQNNLQEVFFEAYTFKSERVYVWECDFQNGFISKHGSVVINNKVLCTDWDHRGFEHRFWKRDKRPLKFVKKLIPLLSHHQDLTSPSVLTGYYDFVLMVAAKLSRIKDALGSEDVRDIAIAYHPFGGHYEKEYLELLGFKAENYIDTRVYKLSADKVIFGNAGSWKPSVEEIKSLKKNIEQRLNISPLTPSAGNRIYISRNGRRKIENENELIELLKEFDFIIIEDKERSVAEQIEIYRNASFIIGPHGASFANIIWCRPETFLYELFSKSWYPDYFLYLSSINNMRYAAYQDETSEEINGDLFKSLCQDIHVSIPTLRASLEKILGKSASA